MPEEPALLQAREPAFHSLCCIIFQVNKDPRYWHSRGYLPHFDADGFTQFITFRLADSMPQSVLNKWRNELDDGEITDADFRRRIEHYLDQNYGAGRLRDQRIAEILQETLLKWDGGRYKLYSWSIMPNHGHILLTPEPGFELADIMHSIKSYTAHEANTLLKRTGQFWAKDYFDRYIRDYKHFASTIKYIENNPVKAKLCNTPEEWPYGSAYFRYYGSAYLDKCEPRTGSLTPGTQAPSPASVPLREAEVRDDNST